MAAYRLAALAALSFACSGGTVPAPAPAPSGSSGPADRVTAIADQYFAGFAETFPEAITFSGIAGQRHDGLTDLSPAARRRWREREDRWLGQLQAIDAAPLAGTPEGVTYGVLRQALEASRGARVCHQELWSVNQLFGWQVTLPRLAQLQPLGTDEARRQALARWRQIPRFIDQAIANLREGIGEGYTAPKGNVRAVLKQVDAMLAAEPESSPFAALATRDSTPAFRTAVVALVRDGIAPALRRYREYLAGDYLAAARENPAVSALPHGAECYRAAIRTFTTLDMNPEAIHRLGLEQMDRIEREMRVIAERSFGTSDVHGLLQRLRTDPQYTFRTREEMVQVAERAIQRARAAAPRWFDRVPKADMIVDPCQPFEEESGCPGSYVQPAEDGSRPGRYRINTGNPTSHPRASAEATAFHEGIPGHHFQLALAQERPHAHPVNRLLFTSGFVEGWALYAERLADEMGLYSGDLDRMGLLSNDALRAARLVVDPAIHVLGWSRQQAIDYMLAHTAESPGMIESEVDRYIILPGQATSYMIGRLEIERLRGEARSRLGSRFDIRAFHDRVLEDGSVTLGMLRAKIERWLAAA